MPDGFAAGVGIGKNVNVPAGVSLTTAFCRSSVNQRFPSGPLAIPPGTMLQGAVGGHGENPVICPAVVIRPMKKSGKPEAPVNHNAPSGPETMSSGPEFWFGTANSVTLPAASMRPILATLAFWSDSVNHMLPSGPAVICRGWTPAVGTRKTLKCPVGAAAYAGPV